MIQRRSMIVRKALELAARLEIKAEPVASTGWVDQPGQQYRVYTEDGPEVMTGRTMVDYVKQVAKG